MQKYKRIIFSDHCEERQSQRGITKQQKLRVLKDPTNELPAKRAGRRKFWNSGNFLMKLWSICCRNGHSILGGKNDEKIAEPFN